MSGGHIAPRRVRAALGFVLSAAALGGCALPAGKAAMAGRTVEVEGRPYLVSPLTASTWTVTSPAGKQSLPRATTPALLKAVETVSGCKVTDSDYSQDGLQLDAQVDCDGIKS